MTKIIVVLPKLDDAKSIKNILVQNGFSSVAVCTSGAQTLSYADNLNGGIIISGYKLTDMMYNELYDFIPPDFEMLLLASRTVLTECIGNDIMCLGMPLKVHELLNTVTMMATSLSYRLKKKKKQPRTRNPHEAALVQEAKCLLMSRNNMTEEEAHRYLQKCSMDNSTNLVETANMVLSIMKS